MSGPDAAERLLAVRPSSRQLRWQALEAYAFVHFGMNTCTDREWGLGDEDPALFAPDGLDPDQWMAAFAAAGLRGVILTAKHHDGFCLWPSAATRHSVASSPWRGGRGDVVREVADAARRAGLAFGVYLSPWDRAEPSYGSGAAYDDVYVAQLTELLTGYGPLFAVWLDGANGEGPDGRVQHYDWERYYATIRRLQPDAVIAVSGPDVRWIGNEDGEVPADVWSVDAEELRWYPAEVDVSIRPGWFHHPAEDGAVRSADELFELYLRAVGGNCCLLLNVPPTRAGVLAAPDVAALAGLGERVRQLEARRLEASVFSRSPYDYTLVFDAARPVDAVVLREWIADGQRVEHVVVSGASGREEWRVLAEAGTVGYQRILRFAPAVVERMRVEVTASRGEPKLALVAALRPATAPGGPPAPPRADPPARPPASPAAPR